MSYTIVDAEQYRILQAYVDRLISQIEDYSPSTCFVSDTPNPIVIPPADRFCVVSAGDGTFPEAMTASAGENQLTEEGTVDITPYQQYAIDETGRLQAAMLDPSRGMMVRSKKEILRALLKDAWEPSFKGDMLCRDLPMIQRCSAPRLLESEGGLKYLYFTATFQTVFDWDL